MVKTIDIFLLSLYSQHRQLEFQFNATRLHHYRIALAARSSHDLQYIQHAGVVDGDQGGPIV